MQGHIRLVKLKTTKVESNVILTQPPSLDLADSLVDRDHGGRDTLLPPAVKPPPSHIPTAWYQGRVQVRADGGKWRSERRHQPRRPREEEENPPFNPARSEFFPTEQTWVMLR